MWEIKKCSCGGEAQIQLKLPKKADKPYVSVVCKSCGKQSKWIVSSREAYERVVDDWNSK